MIRARFWLATVVIYLVSPIHYQYAWIRMCMEYGCYVPYFQGMYFYYSSINMMMEIMKEVIIEHGH